MATVGSLFVGAGGHADLTVTNGGIVNTLGLSDHIGIGVGPNSKGEFTLDGVAAINGEVRSSTLFTSASALVGADGGEGVLSIENGATATLQKIIIGSSSSTGVVRVDGAVEVGNNLHPSSLRVFTTIDVGSNGSGLLHIVNGGRFTSQNAKIGVIGQSQGIARVEGTDSLWENTDNIIVGSSEPLFGGFGTLTISNEGRVITDTLNVADRGTVNIFTGGTLQTDVLTIDPFGLVFLSFGVIEPYTTASTTIVKEGATLAGIGTINGDVFNEGHVRPGNSPGELIIVGRYTQNTSGVLHLEIAGSGPGQSDRLTVLGGGTLDATIEVSFIDGFAPKMGDTFDLIQISGTINGNFTHIRVRNLAEGFLFTSDFVDGSLHFTALNDGVFVPEPSAFTLAALSLLGLLGCGRQRRQRAA